MLLVAGGQLDPNIGALLRRILARKVNFADLLVGPKLLPRLRFDLDTDGLWIDGKAISPRGCFIRHDVFSQQAKPPVIPAEALGWYYAIKGWALSRAGVRLFNRSSAGDGSKISNLIQARAVGLEIPQTIISNEIEESLLCDTHWISKPVGGGEYTVDLVPGGYEKVLRSPHFFQQKMHRPELRIYRIGNALFPFSIESPDIDYRMSKNVSIDVSVCEEGLASRFVLLCDRLGLEFAAADFMRHPKTGAMVFLEINSQPMFVAFDRLMEGKMSDAIIDWLSPTAGSS